MRITATDSETFFLDLTDGKKIRLPNHVIAEVSAGGVLTILDGDVQTSIYPPTAWTCLKKRDPAAVTARMIAKNGIPDSPEGLIE